MIDNTRCPKCGIETLEDVCPLCGEIIRKVERAESSKKNPEKSLKIHRFFPFPAKIVLVLWVLDTLYMLVSKQSEINVIECLGVFLFGCVFFVGITDVMYFKWKKKKTVNINKSLTSSDSIQTENISRSIKYDEKYDLMDGHEFEHFCGKVLEKNGFANVEVTKGSGDQGIDIIASKDGIKYGIQCKCYTSSIGNKAVQEAFAGKTYYGCHVAAVLTNRHFTKSAKDLAETNGVLLWDREKLNDMISCCTTTTKSDGLDESGVVSIENARKMIQPFVYNEYLKVLYRQYPNDKIRAIESFSHSHNLSLRESKKIVDEFYKTMK